MGLSSPQYTAVPSPPSEYDISEDQSDLHKDEEGLLGYEQAQPRARFSEPTSLPVRVFASRRTIAANVLLLSISIILLLLSLHLRTQNATTCPESPTIGAHTCPEEPSILYCELR